MYKWSRSFPVRLATGMHWPILGLCSTNLLGGRRSKHPFLESK